MNCDELLWSAGVALLGSVALNAANRNHPPTANKLDIELASLYQGSNARSGDLEIRRRVFKRSASRFPGILMVDFYRKGHDFCRPFVCCWIYAIVEVVS